MPLIDLRRMRGSSSMAIPPVPDYSADDIKAIRARQKMSQAVLATALNASLSTIRQWEIGQKKPSGPAAKLLNILDRKGLEALT